uniref:PreC/core protein n=1 Tax=White sucker hepatitis B virus TaxID=1690672 RepID=A0A7U3QRL3_9HEPA|nr:preC/core protein [White sucker hepatitis B virus]
MFAFVLILLRLWSGCLNGSSTMDPLVKAALEGVKDLPHDFFPLLKDQVQFSKDVIKEYNEHHSQNRHVEVINCSLESFDNLQLIYAKVTISNWTAIANNGDSVQVALDENARTGLAYIFQSTIEMSIRRKLWWHTNCLMWGESQTAEYTAKLRSWLMTPTSYRNQYAPTIEALTRTVKATHLSSRSSRPTARSPGVRARSSSKSKSKSPRRKT